MSTGGNAGKQSRSDQSGGGNMVGSNASKSRLHQPPKFQGRSGQGDNQSTNRGPGRS